MLIFKTSSGIFTPYIYFAMLKIQKRKYRLLGEPHLQFWPYLKYSFGSNLRLLGTILEALVCILTIILMQRKSLAIFWQTDRQMDIINPEFSFHFSIDNQYALLRTPNAWHDVLMGIFTPCLFFQCVFNHFQCVITLLRALSVTSQINIYIL